MRWRILSVRIDVEEYNEGAESLGAGCDVRVRFALIVAAVGSLFFALSAWSQILIWGVIAIAVGWAFFTVFREA